MVTSYKKIFLISIISFLGLLIPAHFIFYKKDNVATGPIYEYVASRDHDDIVALFELERFWLTVSDYSPTFMLKDMAPYKGLEYRNILHVAVIRPDTIFAGFTAFYIEKPEQGRILFVAVRPEFRGKGYAKMLVRHAIAELKKLGARQVNLVTRTTNFPAQKVYVDIGFDETARDQGPQGHVYYEHTK